jgi:hypothetical protein
MCANWRKYEGPTRQERLVATLEQEGLQEWFEVWRRPLFGGDLCQCGICRECLDLYGYWWYDWDGQMVF